MENYVAQLFSWVQTFTPLICLLVWHSKLENWTHCTGRHLSLKQVPKHRLCRYIDVNHQQKPKKRHIEWFSDESVFSGNAATVVLKIGAALIFANFFQHCTAAEFVEITRTGADHLPWQPTIAAELLLDGTVQWGQKALNKVSSHPHRIYLTKWTFISWMGLKLTLKQFYKHNLKIFHPFPQKLIFRLQMWLPSCCFKKSVKTKTVMKMGFFAILKSLYLYRLSLA
jgi:hypothetical protein